VANPERHRQGLVYGPVRPTGPRDRGQIVGNLLGLLVVVVTVGVLGMAIYFFLQNRPAPPPASAAPPSFSATVEPSGEPSATGTPAASATTAPTLPATLPPTAPPTPPLQPSGAPLATPLPTPFVPQVVVGPGFITFGSTVNDELEVIDAKTTFGIDEAMVWSAYLSETADSTDLRIRILKQDASQPSGMALLREDAVKPDVTDAHIFVRHLRPLGSTFGAGLYTIEYVRGDQVLSSGSFLVQ
jgi:hypothetical protein